MGASNNSDYRNMETQDRVEAESVRGRSNNNRNSSNNSTPAPSSSGGLDFNNPMSVYEMLMGLSTPEPRDLGQEYRQILGAMSGSAPQVYDLERQYRPQYLDLDLQNYRQALLGNNGMINTQADARTEELNRGINRMDTHSAALIDRINNQWVSPLQAQMERMAPGMLNARPMTAEREAFNEGPIMNALDRAAFDNLQSPVADETKRLQQLAMQRAEGELSPLHQYLQQRVMADMEGDGSPLRNELEQQAMARLDAGPRPLQARLEQEAMAGLDSGMDMTPQERRLVEQQSRTAFASRGLERSMPSVADEMLNTFALGRTLQDQRRAFALGVDRAGMDQIAQQYSQAMGLDASGYDQRMGLSQLARGLDMDAHGQALARTEQAAGMNQAAFGERMGNQQFAQNLHFGRAGMDAQLAAQGHGMKMDYLNFGRSVDAAGQGQRWQTAGLLLGNTPEASGPAGAMMGSAGPRMFDPANNQYASQLYGQNYGGAWSGYNAQSNMLASLYGGQMQMNAAQMQADASRSAGRSGMLGGILGGVAGGLGAWAGCWSAREAFDGGPEWLEFRRWMQEEAPAGFRAWYNDGGGETAAEELKHNPACKVLVRELMRVIIRANELEEV